VIWPGGPKLWREVGPDRGVGEVVSDPRCGQNEVQEALGVAAAASDAIHSAATAPPPTASTSGATEDSSELLHEGSGLT
jgi:hypothetical protein